jgi:hypothetical protein
MLIYPSADTYLTLRILRSSRRAVKRVAWGAVEEKDVEDGTARITWPRLVCPIITLHAGDNIM